MSLRKCRKGKWGSVDEEVFSDLKPEVLSL